MEGLADSDTYAYEAARQTLLIQTATAPSSESRRACERAIVHLHLHIRTVGMRFDPLDSLGKRRRDFPGPVIAESAILLHLLGTIYSSELNRLGRVFRQYGGRHGDIRILCATHRWHCRAWLTYRLQDVSTSAPSATLASMVCWVRDAFLSDLYWSPVNECEQKLNKPHHRYVDLASLPGFDYNTDLHLDDVSW